MKDRETISQQPHELNHAASELGVPVWLILKAINDLGTNKRSEVYQYIRNNIGSFVEPERPVNLNPGTVEELDKSYFLSDKMSLTDYVKLCYQRSFDAGWHTDLKTGELQERNKGEMLMLIVSEIAEAMEGERKNLSDDHLPHRKMAEVELADAFIRICDYAGRWGYDLEGAVKDKLEYNQQRADHKPENRLKDGGKSW